MGEITPGASGADAKASGESNSSNSQAQSGADDGTYPSHFVDKLKKEKHSQAVQLREARDKIDALEKQHSANQSAELEKEKKYEQLWGQEKELHADARDKLVALESKVLEGRKRSAIKEHLVKLGLNPKHETTAFRLIDSSNVIVDEKTNTIVGAEEAAREFHKANKELGIFGQHVPGVSQAAPETRSNVPLDIPKMSALEIKKHLSKSLSGG